MFSDRFAVYFSMGLTAAFMIICIIDVTGMYPLMNNVAILLLLVLAFSLLLFNAIIAKNEPELEETPVEKKMPEPEEDSSEYRQI